MRPLDIVVWFSCGAASAVAAKKTIEMFPGDRVRVVNTPVDEEDQDNRRFLKDVESWIGQKIEIVGGGSAQEVWRKRRFMSSPYGAPCTLVLKKEARYQFEKQWNIDIHVLGFTSDEKKRYDAFIVSERENVRHVLGELGITKQDCFAILKEAGIELPRVYKHLPNANCIGCVKATSPTYWNVIRRQYPEAFKDRAELSRELGAKLVRYKGMRIFLDELPENAKGAPLKNMDTDCGIFCKPENL